jgi:hypothetical protein
MNPNYKSALLGIVGNVGKDEDWVLSDRLEQWCSAPQNMVCWN